MSSRVVTGNDFIVRCAHNVVGRKDPKFKFGSKLVESVPLDSDDNFLRFLKGCSPRKVTHEWFESL